MFLIVALITLFLLLCLGLGWWMLPERRRVTVSAPRRRWRLPRCVRRHGVLAVVAALVLVVPPLLVVSLRQNVELKPFRSTDLAESHSMIAELLRGERLVPPPPPPPEVFTNAEMRRFHPEVISADRRWDKVDGALRQRVLAIYRVMKQQYGVEMVLVEGFRDAERQRKLMGKGASLAGAWRSCHQYGLAVDSAPLKDGMLQWDMEGPWTRRAYFLYGELAKEAGLAWGGDWTNLKDYVHVESRDRCLAARRARQARLDAQGGS